MNKLTTHEQEVQDFGVSEETRSAQLKRFMNRVTDTLVIAGLGSSVTVKQRSLHVRGYGDTETILYPGAHTIKRIIWISVTGHISISAIQWLKRENVALQMFSEYGDNQMLVQSEDFSDTRLRRKQYSMTEEQMLEYSRVLLQQKVLAQAETLKKHSTMLVRAEEKAREIEGISEWFTSDSATCEHMHLEAKHLHIPVAQRYMQKEASCANIYFEAWKSLELKWQNKARVPGYWLKYNTRHDANHQTARNACHPVNALLNFAYCLLATRIELACVAKGLDVACGVLHADSKRRASLIWDLIEPARAMIDDLVLTFVERNKLLAGDFLTEDSGTVKLAPQFAKLFAAYISSNIEKDMVHGIVNAYVEFLG